MLYHLSFELSLWLDRIACLTPLMTSGASLICMSVFWSLLLSTVNSLHCMPLICRMLRIRFNRRCPTVFGRTKGRSYNYSDLRGNDDNERNGLTDNMGGQEAFVWNWQSWLKRVDFMQQHLLPKQLVSLFALFCNCTGLFANYFWYLSWPIFIIYHVFFFLLIVLILVLMMTLLVLNHGFSEKVRILSHVDRTNRVGSTCLSSAIENDTTVTGDFIQWCLVVGFKFFDMRFYHRSHIFQPVLLRNSIGSSH